jgi:hypothetical protein
MTPHLLQVDMDACRRQVSRRVSAKQTNAEAVCEFQYIRLTSNSSIFVLRRALYWPERHGGICSSCDDIAVVCLKLSQTSQYQTPNANI